MGKVIADVVILGGGVIGCATAWELARRGLSVVVVERDTPGLGATSAAAGMLSPLSESEEAGPFLELALSSLDRYPSFVAALFEETGIDVEYRQRGKLEVAFDEAGEARLRATYGWRREAGFVVDWLDADEARRMEPALSPRARAGLFNARDHQVDNRRLGRAAWLAAERAGARFLTGTPALAIRSAAGRVRGVALANGEVVTAPRVVLALGSWSGGLDGLPRPLPVFPVRGEIIALEAAPSPLTRVVSTGRCYLVSRAEGRVLVGATAERAGFQSRATAGGVQKLLAAAIEAVPALAGAPIAELWGGLRPGTPDTLPILGPDPEVEGLVYATGHYRNGILLAPITAQLVMAAVVGERPALSLAPFAVDRFDVKVAR
jgi:glycine oxidase